MLHFVRIERRGISLTISCPALTPIRICRNNRCNFSPRGINRRHERHLARQVAAKIGDGLAILRCQTRRTRARAIRQDRPEAIEFAACDVGPHVDDYAGDLLANAGGHQMSLEVIQGEAFVPGDHRNGGLNAMLRAGQCGAAGKCQIIGVAGVGCIQFCCQRWGGEPPDGPGGLPRDSPRPVRSAHPEASGGRGGAGGRRNRRRRVFPAGPPTHLRAVRACTNDQSTASDTVHRISQRTENAERPARGLRWANKSTFRSNPITMGLPQWAAALVTIDRPAQNPCAAGCTGTRSRISSRIVR